MQREIEKLQLLVMDHETSIETLSEEYRRQQEVIAALQLQVRELSSRLNAIICWRDKPTLMAAKVLTSRAFSRARSTPGSPGSFSTNPSLSSSWTGA